LFTQILIENAHSFMLKTDFLGHDVLEKRDARAEMGVLGGQTRELSGSIYRYFIIWPSFPGFLSIDTTLFSSRVHLGLCNPLLKCLDPSESESTSAHHNISMRTPHAYHVVPRAVQGPIVYMVSVESRCPQCNIYVLNDELTDDNKLKVQI